MGQAGCDLPSELTLNGSKPFKNIEGSWGQHGKFDINVEKRGEGAWRRERRSDDGRERAERREEGCRERKRAEEEESAEITSTFLSR